MIARLERIEGVQVLSPYAIGGDRALREPPNQALLTLQVSRSEEQVSKKTLPAVQDVLDDVNPPIAAELSGRAPLVRALNDASLDSLDKGEKIAFPILILLLLLVFRSPIAALVPLGYPLSPFRPTKRKPLAEVLHYDRWRGGD